MAGEKICVKWRQGEARCSEKAEPGSELCWRHETKHKAETENAESSVSKAEIIAERFDRMIRSDSLSVDEAARLVELVRGSVRMITRLPVLEQMSGYCAPNEGDLFIASHVVGESCPFCGNRSIIALPRFNAATGIYGYTINCTNDLKCGASVFTNGLDREKVRADAMKRWNTRTPKTN